MGFLSSLFGIGGGSSKPATQQVIQSTKLPEEIAPFAKDILERAQTEFERRTAEGYTPYEGATIAPFTAQEEAAQEGIQALVGTSRPLQEEALALTRQQQQQFTPEVAEQFMSPYQRAVTDIEKREAQRTFERDIMPQLEAQAIGAGGMSGLGTRAALQASEAQRNQAQLLADIEARGLQSAFQDARQSFEQQKARERAQAADVFAAGPAMFASGLKEQGALQTVGEQRRDLAQSALDEEYFKFLEEQAFPQERLAEYSGFVYGNPLLQQRTRTSTGTMQQAQPSLGRQLLGLAGTGVGIYGMGGGFKPGGQFSLGNLYSNVFGATGGGLSDLVKRQMSGRIGMSEETELTPEEIAFMRSRGVPAEVAAIAKDLKARREKAEALETRRREAEAGIGDVAVTPSRETEEIANQQARQQQLQNILRMREESEGGVGDAPDTPSLETEEEARRQVRQGPLQDILRIRQESEKGVGDAPVTPSLETEQLARQQVRQSDLQNLLKMRQQAEAGAGASDLGQRMNPALQRELAARDREMARMRQLAEITQGVTGADVNREAVAIPALDPLSPEAMLKNAMSDPNFVLAQNPSVGISALAKDTKDVIPAASAASVRPVVAGSEPDAPPVIDPLSPEAMLKNYLEKNKGKQKRPDTSSTASAKSITAQDRKPENKTVSAGNEKINVPPSNELNKLTGKVTQTSEFATMMAKLGEEEKKLIDRFGKFEKLQEQLAKAQEEDGKNQLARANRANEINFWQGIVNIGGRLASTDDNWIGIISDETSKFMDRRKLLDAEITNKTGAAKIAALKTRADIVLKDINFLNSLAKTKSERIKATADWLKANGASKKDSETKSKNFMMAVQKYAGEDWNRSGRKPEIERLIKVGVPLLTTMSSAEAFKKALEITKGKSSEKKVEMKKGGSKPSDTVDKASEKLKAQKMFGANKNE